MAGNQDMRDASETYTGFLSLLKWGTIVSIAVTALVLLIIA
ncbi:aa3-type cytochrome c oxidase subunit IV [Sphingorhabdus buctiana]|uniref:Aa3-type cytochrome c oxidase subunit IV n=1 Tax=Sphingorhabdus buctiana TaxID=1508805 RepID=A0ABW4MBN4_9SPHN